MCVVLWSDLSCASKGLLRLEVRSRIAGRLKRGISFLAKGGLGNRALFCAILGFIICCVGVACISITTLGQG